MKILNQGFDHVEFVLNDIDAHAATYRRMGYEKIGERHLPEKGTRSVVWAQGFVRIMLTQPEGNSKAGDSQESVKFLRDLNEGICVLAIDVDDATLAWHGCTRGNLDPRQSSLRFHRAQSARRTPVKSVV